MSGLRQALKERANKFEVPLAEEKTKFNTIMVILDIDSRSKSDLPHGSYRVIGQVTAAKKIHLSVHYYKGHSCCLIGPLEHWFSQDTLSLLS